MYYVLFDTPEGRRGFRALKSDSHYAAQIEARDLQKIEHWTWMTIAKQC